jgi:hypothetical protein
LTSDGERGDSRPNTVWVAPSFFTQATFQMVPTEPQDDGGHYPTYAELLTDLECEVAAIFRQYRRATDAHDNAASVVEVDAIACRIRRMLYVHLEARVGMSSGQWVWLDGDDECNVEVEGTLMSVSGRIWCSLPEGRREWTEPFSAQIVHDDQAQQLTDYTFFWGTHATLLNLREVERLVRACELLRPHAPANLDGWAYVFRMGETAEPEPADA